MPVRSAASGVDISKLSSNTVGPVPNYRSWSLVQKVIDICTGVKGLNATASTHQGEQRYRGPLPFRFSRSLPYRCRTRFVP
ncbi:hypothetical protein F5B19DRAFT_399805 [Rostrohypoxylon terebratum]|nr:hypothetical protein F5B19DRAFT_399805 [Rostrohypoxylon terebratum]